MEVLQGDSLFWKGLSKYLNVGDYRALFSASKLFKPVLVDYYRKENCYYTPEEACHENFSFTPKFRSDKLDCVRYLIFDGTFSGLLTATERGGFVGGEYVAHLGVYHEVADQFRKSEPLAAYGKETEVIKQPQFEQIGSGTFSFNAATGRTHPVRMAELVVNVGNVIVAGDTAVKLHFERHNRIIKKEEQITWTARMSRSYRLRQFKESSPLPRMIRAHKGYIYALNEDFELSIHRVEASGDSAVEIENSIFPYQILEVKGSSLRPIVNGGYFEEAVFNTLGGWCVESHKRIHFLKLHDLHDINVIKIFTFEAASDSKRKPDFDVEASYQHLDRFVPERTSFHSDSIASHLSCLGGPVKNLFPEYKVTECGKILCVVKNSRLHGLIRCLVIDSKTCTLVSNVVLEGDLGTGFSAYHFDAPTHVTLQDGTMILSSMVALSSHQYGYRAAIISYKAIDPKASAGCTLVGNPVRHSEFDPAVAYDTKKEHIFLQANQDLFDEMPHDRRRNSRQKDSFKVTIYQTINDEPTELNCGGLEHVRFRNSGAIDTGDKFFQDRAGRWYVCYMHNNRSGAKRSAGGEGSAATYTTIRCCCLTRERASDGEIEARKEIEAKKLAAAAAAGGNDDDNSFSSSSSLSGSP